MILIKVFGLDQYAVADYSKEHTANLAKLLETKEEEIMFYAPNSFIFHKGVEQTSWNATIEVVLPEKYHQIQANVTKYLIESFSIYSINLHIYFTYIHDHHFFECFNKKYPRFITENNSVKVEDNEVSDEDLCDEEKVYTGNVFKDFNKKNK